jgi:RNA polymerase sigma-70 factor (ECF subfamily)
MALSPKRDFAAIVRDEWQFREWYDVALPRVYRYLVARCAGDTALAEELTQETFVEGHPQRASVRWTRRCGDLAVRDRPQPAGRPLPATRARRAEEGAPGSGHLVRDIEAPWRGTEVRAAVEAALRELPPDQRLALLFRHLDGIPVREVARIMGRSEKATESLLARARDGFRRAYRGETDA